MQSFIDSFVYRASSMTVDLILASFLLLGAASLRLPASLQIHSFIFFLFIFFFWAQPRCGCPHRFRFIHSCSFFSFFFLLGAASLRLPASLQIKVAVEKFRPTLDKCCKKGQGKERGPFYGCNAQFISSLVTKLKSTFLMPVQQKSHKPATTTPERAVFTRFRRPS